MPFIQTEQLAVEPAANPGVSRPSPAAPSVVPTDSIQPPLTARPFTLFVVASLFLTAIFIRPLLDLINLALQTDLYSHVLLIPFVTGYLIWLRKDEFRMSADKKWSVPLLICGAVVIAAYWSARWRGWAPAEADYLAATISSFLLLILGAAVYCFSDQIVKRWAFALSFLIFMVPLPVAATHGIEVFFQHASADAAHILFNLFGTPVFRQDLVFTLPNLLIEVAEECSGVRSSFVLFITSCLAAYLFLRSNWSRALLVASIVPIGIVRNAFRIVSISLLTIHVDPDVIHGPLHHRGGPIFFLLSLIPFFALLFFLRARERRKAQTTHATIP